MICIYCLQDREPEHLVDEHLIPQALGGWLSLGKAACASCNNIVVNRLDHFLSARFPPTSLACTDLDLRSYSKAAPHTMIVGHDKVIGQFEALLTPGGRAQIKTTVMRRGDNRGTARALGLTIPPSLLLRADQVIE